MGATGGTTLQPVAPPPPHRDFQHLLRGLTCPRNSVPNTTAAQNHDCLAIAIL